MSEIPAGFGQVNVNMVYGFALKPCQTSFGIQASGDADDIAQAIFDVLGTTLATFMTSAVGFTEVEVLTPSVVGVSTGNVVAGDITSESCPPNVAILAKKLTGLRGRMNNGRNYFPGIQESQVNDDGVINDVFLAGVQTGLDDFFSDVNAIAGVDNIVLLHGEGSALPPVVMSGWRAEPVVATQRRRLTR